MVTSGADFRAKEKQNMGYAATIEFLLLSFMVTRISYGL